MIQKTYYLPLDKKDEQIPVHLWKNNDSSNALIIFLHGFPGSPLNQLKNIPVMLNSLGLMVITWNYPGLWGTAGTFSVESIEKALSRLNRLITEEIEPESIFLYGHSFGGLVATAIVAKKIIPVKKVVLQSPLLNTKAIDNPRFNYTYHELEKAHAVKFTNGPPDSSYLNKINPINWLSQTLTIPFWGVMGSNDEVLSADIMKQVIVQYPHIKLEFWENFPHTNLNEELQRKFVDKMNTFLND